MKNPNVIILGLVLTISLATGQTLYDLIQQPNFSKFFNSVNQFQPILDIFRGSANYSVFAPTDNAIPDNLLTLEQLNYCIISGSPSPTTLVQNRIYPSILNLDGYGVQYIKFSSDPLGQLLVNNIPTEAAAASNGYLYPINRILLFPPDLPSALRAIDAFSLLESALSKMNLTLPPNITLFAPLNTALNSSMNIVENPNQFEKIFSWHISNSIYSSVELRSMETIKTISNLSLVITSPDGSTVIVNGSLLVPADDDIVFKNGVIHGISHLILPAVDALFEVYNLTTLSTLIGRAGLWNQILGPSVTIFAPTNDAFEGINATEIDISRVLLYHVVPGLQMISTNTSSTQVLQTALPAVLPIIIPQVLVVSGGEVNNALIFSANQPGSNVYVNLIDDVLMPPVLAFETISQTSDFVYLAKMLLGTGLTNVFNADVLTIFAPTDPAWLQLRPEYFNFLTDSNNNSRSKLELLLKNHVVPSAVLYSIDFSTGIVPLPSLVERITLTNNDTGIFIANAQITKPNIIASNAVIHGIDGFVFPSSLTISILELLPYLQCAKFAKLFEETKLTSNLTRATVLVALDTNITKELEDELNEAAAIRSLILPEYLNQLAENVKYHTLEPKITIRRQGNTYYLEENGVQKNTAQIVKQVDAFPVGSGSIIVLNKPLLNVEGSHGRLSSGAIAAIVIVVIAVVVVVVVLAVWKLGKNVPYESVK